MGPKQHALIDIWDSYPLAIAKHSRPADKLPDIEKIVAQMFAIGDFYHYVIDVANGTVSDFNESVLRIHSLDAYPIHLKEIIDLIHPDDIGFVRNAENWSLEKIGQIGYEHQPDLKSSYCFRMKTSEDRYELFHHQAIHAATDENGLLLHSINIHTNIHHITRRNNFIVTVSGLGDLKICHQAALHPRSNGHTAPLLTKKEKEILVLLYKGLTDKEIAGSIHLSHHTVRTHHKNILRKLDCRKTAELIKKCIESGYL
ncbi:helix-turn-helix transcriptional regulator [Niabella beijingensis]|uniref:helix-turn-helix transcriptional regulator n=1 Tax=Niabella beijingensis TaxID=2872700 RepID=UPI001CBB47A1|nr:helix-turn-helix transcriptional regulator [Niabella beijingensis]MBZ4192469.1 helix-turn-helix transcriptional regulator [Niabella beijingensis]